MRILTITPNPAIDQTVELDKLLPGEVHRARSVRLNAGGKGVNVSSCLADWGVVSTAAGFLGVGNAMLFDQLFRDKGIVDEFIRIGGDSRTNIKIVGGGGTTDINLPGARISDGDVGRLRSRLECLSRPDLAIMSGSLPPGCPVGFYRDMAEWFSGEGIPVILDADGEALRTALAGEVLPACVKPNCGELAGWVGCGSDDRDALLSGARDLVKRGVKLVAVSLGSDGAYFVSGDGALWARGAPEQEIVSSVGAGDAMVAGLGVAFAEDAGTERIARLSTAFALAKLPFVGPNLPDRSVVEGIAKRVEIKVL